VPVVMVTNRASVQSALREARRGGLSGPRRAFTLIDMLASMAIIALLVSLMLPSLSGVREATRRVVCQSNIHQIALGAFMYNEDNQGKGPPAAYASRMLARTDDIPGVWDGLGILYQTEYTGTPPVFYCPSHSGDHPYAKYASVWPADSGEIITNYQYRGTLEVAAVSPDRAALFSDGLTTQSDFSHKIGTNVARGDHSVQWVSDIGGVLLRSLPLLADQPDVDSKVSTAWQQLDDPRSPGHSGN
jgi:type II secretory pathway pseudopilin PulG